MDHLNDIPEITAGESLPETFETKAAVRVYSYAELASWFQIFGRAPGLVCGNAENGEGAEPTIEELEIASEEEIPLFVIAGPPGTGKTKHMKTAINDSTLYIEGGRISAFGLYCDLYPRRFDPKIVIDDAETVLKDADGRNLAKGICQTARVKTVSWRTLSKELKERGIPRHYRTTASMGIITNDIEILNDRHLGPLLSRGVLIEFTPSKYEIHAQTSTWFLDGQAISQEIYEFMADHLDEIGLLDMRLYYTSRVMARRGQDWRAYLKEKLLGWDSREVLAERLMADPTYPTIAARIEVFKRLTGYNKTTFNNIVTRRGLREFTNRPRVPTGEHDVTEEPRNAVSRCLGRQGRRDFPTADSLRDSLNDLAAPPATASI